MRRARALAPALVAFAAVALAAEKGPPLVVRVEEEGGAVHEGKARFKKDVLEIDTAGGTKKLPWRKVTSYEEVDTSAPPSEADLAKDKVELEARKKTIEGSEDKDPKKLATSWNRLAAWARRRGMEDEARLAWQKVLELAADDAEAHRGLGEAKAEDGSWKPIPEIFTAKRKAAKPDATSQWDLARWAAKNGLDKEALSVILPIGQKNWYDKQLLGFLRPVTDRWEQKTPLAFPLKGRWGASEDPSRHHESKGFAVYAIDFTKIVDGKEFKNKGNALEDWYGFGAPVLAAADGEVYNVTEGYPDNPLYKCEGKAELHNGVSIMHENGEGTWYIHLKKGSVKVKKGDRVKKGDVIGEVGNSGGSAVPHLHFTMVSVYHYVSIPWQCDDWQYVTADGTKVKVKRGRVLEGALCETPE